ncbi:LysR family transcriptional regulator [Pseudorhodoferax sp.]|uniref:LysR family transcriptional regulator n=1 Tax=Pseudorhodoferax sp. TaxID=1993553 RepID=UPI0039E6681F
MELRHLRYFVTVARLGSMSRAAQKLFIAQPPLSAQIRQLEEEVGATLFVRLPRGVRLTPAGQSFLEDATAILARAEQAAVRARECQAGQRATLRLGLVPSATHTLLPGLLQSLGAQQGAAVTVEAREMISARQIRALRNDELDLCFARPGGEGAPWPELLCGIDDPYCLALPAGHALADGSAPLPLAAAARESFVGFSRYQEADFFDLTAALCAQAGFAPRIRNEAGQFVNVLEMVACGLGLAIVPWTIAAQPLAEGLARRLRFRALQAVRQHSRLVILRGERLRGEPWFDAACALAQAQLEALGRRIRPFHAAATPAGKRKAARSAP